MSFSYLHLVLFFLSFSSTIARRGSRDDSNDHSSDRWDDSDDYNGNELTLEILEDLREDIEERINLFTRPDDEDDALALLATIVRLTFHDCGGLGYSDESPAEGICNGCIDPFNSNHAGLEYGVIYPLEQVYQNQNVLTIDRYNETITYNPSDSTYVWTNPSNRTWSNILTRADFWMIAGTMAVEYGVELAYADNAIDETGVPRPETWNDALEDGENIRYYYGRTNEGCNSNTPFNNNPSISRFEVDQLWGFSNLSSFFNDRFDFDEGDTVAIMGAHTLGRAHRKIDINNLQASENDDSLCCGGSGHRDGWVQRNKFMVDNGYYNQLMSFHDFNAVWQQKQPCEQQEDVCDEGFLTDEEALQWKVKRCAPFPNACSTDFSQMMLNIDMSIAFDIDSFFDESSTNGKVNCNHPVFNANQQDFSTPSCPRNFGEDGGIKEEFDEYLVDNRAWLVSFWEAWVKMTTVGYDYKDLKYIELPKDDE